MPFFYRSHIGRHYQMEHKEIICYAVSFAIPTPFIMKILRNICNAAKKIKQAVGEKDICKKRAVPSVSFSGSLTVEAALTLPVFLGAVLLLTGLFQAIAVYEQLNSCLCMTGRQIAAYGEAYDGSNIADVWRLFYAEIAGSGVDKDSIAGGYSGIILNISEDTTSGLIELEAHYKIKIPGFFVGNQNMAVHDRIYVRPWTGGRLIGGSGTDADNDSIKVYVAENGTVYHTSEDCTYLHLSVRSCGLDVVGSLRNRYGAKYIPCERCGYGSGNAIVYITDTGRAWHSDRQCSGLKRNLETFSLEEAVRQGLRPCSRCASH